MSLIKPNNTKLSPVQVSVRHNVSAPERPAGFAESFPVCSPRGGDSVVCGDR